MKKPEQIADAIAVLRRTVTEPCDCAEMGGAHALECEMIKVVLVAQIVALSWAMGAEPTFQEIIDGLRFTQQQPGGAN